MKRLLNILITLLSLSAFAQETNDSLLMAHLDVIDRQEIPVDTSVRKGVLKNGLTYYVRRCTEPKERAHFSLFVKAGSVLEKDDERGVAHFVEHVLFRGTKHFPGQEVMNFMRRNGIPYGHDSNAFTGCNSVRYLLNGIPCGDVAQLDSCLLLMYDWACAATMADSAIESERSIIVEEWRLKNTVSFGQQLIQDLLNNSIYSQRLSIGDMEVIRNCPPKVVRNFYKRWYQPQNQAIVVMGDFDPDAIVEKIQKLFGTLKRGKNLVPTQPTIPNAEQPRIRFYQDQRLSAHTSSIFIRVPDVLTDHLIGTLRKDQVRDKLKDLMKDKLDALKGKGIINGSASFFTLGDIKDSKNFVLEMSSNADNWEQTLETLLKAIEHTRRFGFKDYERKPGNWYVGAYNADSTAILLPDTAGSDFGSHKSTEWTDKCYNNFFFGTAINDFKSEKTCKNHIKNTITQEQLREAFRELTTGRNMLVTEMFPASATLPTEEEVNEIIRRVTSMTDEELDAMDVKKGQKLERLNVDSLDFDLTPATITKTTTRNDSITEFRLSNGVKVLLWRSAPNDSMTYSIDMKFGRPLGYASLPDEDFHYQSLLFNGRRKFLFERGGNDVEFDPYCDRIDIGTYSSNDSATFWKDVECYLKMMYASLTTTEVDSVEADEKITELRSTAVAFNEPLMKAQLKLQSLPYVQSKRNAIPSVEDVKALSVEGFRRLVKDYFSNFNGSTLIVKGQFPTDTIMPLLLKYIGALPSKPQPVKRAVWPSDHFRTTDTIAVERITNATPYCMTTMFYTWEKNYRFSQETHAHNQVLQSVLGTLLLDKLRQQHSDVYTVNCSVDDKQLPLNRMACVISFACDPSQRERIAADADRLVHEMASGDLVTQDLIDSYVKEREKHAGDTNYGRRYYDLTREMGDIVIDANDVTFIKQVTPASLHAHLRQLLKKGNKHIGYLTTE